MANIPDELKNMIHTCRNHISLCVIGSPDGPEVLKSFDIAIDVLSNSIAHKNNMITSLEEEIKIVKESAEIARRLNESCKR